MSLTLATTYVQQLECLPTTELCSGRSNHDCIYLQNDVTWFIDWSQTWQLHLNSSKCMVLSITDKKTPLTSKLTTTQSTIYRWISISLLLVHISYIDSLHCCQRTMYSFSKSWKRLAVVALVRPHLDCCAPAWNNHHIKVSISTRKFRSEQHTGIASNRTPSHSIGTSRTYDQALSGQNNRPPGTHFP